MIHEEIAETAASVPLKWTRARVSFEFGRRGAHILPFTVRINPYGQVTVEGHVRTQVPNLTLARDCLAGLLKLAEAEGFYDMPDRIEGHSTITDADWLFISIQVQSTPSGPPKTKTVELHAARHEPFDQLFAGLMATAGVEM
jgi:hypothetical protein